MGFPNDWKHHSELAFHAPKVKDKKTVQGARLKMKNFLEKAGGPPKLGDHTQAQQVGVTGGATVDPGHTHQLNNKVRRSISATIV